VLARFKFWLFGGTKEIRQPGIAKSGKAIADELFLWFEGWPLQRFWEVGNAQNDAEDCPYSHFKSRAVQKLAELIDAALKDKTSVLISPPLWMRLYNKYLRRSPRQSFQEGDAEQSLQSWGWRA